jgi:hypothetical protein
LVPNNAPYGSAVGAASANVSVHYRKSLCLTPNTRVLEDFFMRKPLISHKATSPAGARQPRISNWPGRLQLAARSDQADDFLDDISRYGDTVS